MIIPESTKVFITKKAVEKASWKRNLEFLYTSDNGKTTLRNVEVYDYGTEGFYGFDLEDEKTKTFKYAKVTMPTVGEAFEPRFQPKTAKKEEEKKEEEKKD